MNTIKAKKLSFVVNTAILFFVFLLWGFFHIAGAVYMDLFSIPTVCLYLVNYALIKNNKLDVFIWITYFWILLYMSLATLCLGFDMGFHLYSMSLVLVIFVSDYMAYKLNGRRTRAMLISVGIALVYICCTGFSIWNGPIYETPKLYSNIMLAINASIVFAFLIIYSRILLDLVIYSEKQLTKIALYDKLTGLYNRHFVIDYLNENKPSKGSWIAILDIDNFKKINDSYGHAAGDYVLSKLAETLTGICSNSIVSRWGGEEFLILCNDASESVDVLEELRKKVSAAPLEYNGESISITVTVGVSFYGGSESIDNWIQDADKKLYYGKNNGKNVVISEL